MTIKTITNDRIMFYFVLLYGLGYLTEARVFCEDENAQRWIPFGYSCPVMCASVLSAIHRLKIMDYKKTVFQELTVNPNINLNDLNEILGHTDKIKQPKHISNYLHDYSGEAYEPLSRKMYAVKTNDISRELGKMASFNKMADVNVTDVFDINYTRRSLNGDFVNIMTNILNKYVKTTFQFTEEMTEVILQKLFTKAPTNKLYDVNKLLRYLRKAVQIQSNQNNYVITLRPRNCLSVSVPGCFCKPGFVERSGQCVKPSRCIDDESLYRYLNRIVVL